MRPPNRYEHRGPARVFDCEEDCFAAVQSGKIKPNDVVVIRYEGPKGRPGHARDAAGNGGGQRQSGAELDRGAAHRWALQRRNARIHGGARCSGSFVGGPIAAVREGDIIHFDIPNRTLNVEISDAEMAERLKDFKPPALRWPKGVFRKYVDRVTSASEGATT